jgi:hypothetical protein
MRAESKIRVTHRLFGDRCFFPQQLVDGNTIDTVDMALFALRKLEEDGKVRITLTVRSGDTVTYEGDALGFIAQGDPGPDVVVSVRADLTDEWVKEMKHEA